MKLSRPYLMTARAAKAEATRARIWAAAIKLYTDRPIEDFTLEEVAKRAETTVQTVLRAFGSKEKLVYEALDDMAAGGVALRQTPAGDVAEAVRAFHDIYEAMGDLVIQRLADEHRRPALKPSLEAAPKPSRRRRSCVRAATRARQPRRASPIADQSDHRDRRLRLEAAAPRHGARPIRGGSDRLPDHRRRDPTGASPWRKFSG